MTHGSPSSSRRVRVMIVDDSRTDTALLSAIVTSDPRLELVGVVDDGAEALAAVSRLKPDVVTMDIHMPRVDGFEATRQIMETEPRPIIIISASTVSDAIAANFRAIECGALAMVARPASPGHPDHDRSAEELTRTIKAMSEVKVVRRWRRSQTNGAAPPASKPEFAPARLRRGGVDVVAIGASTGGPVVLQTLLGRLSRQLSFPLLIVQHIAPGFTAGFVEWLAKTTGFPVRIAVHGEALLPGRAYVCPDHYHLGVTDGLLVQLTTTPPENGMRPALSHLFRSVRAVCGRRAVGVILTGMGRDGVDELKALHDVGALTVVQNEATSVIFGMPGQAVQAGAVDHQLSPEEIARLLNSVSTPSLP